MPSENKSHSYLTDRERFMRWVKLRKSGQLARENLMLHSDAGNASQLLEDDRFTDYEGIMEEHREGVLVATNCAETRKDFQRTQQGGRMVGLPGGARWLRFASIPAWYHWRKVAEEGDPDYWDDPRSQLRAVLEHPEWSCVPLSVIRGALNDLEPKARKIIRPPTPKIDFVRGGPE